MGTVLIALLLTAGPLKLAAMPLEPGEGIQEKTAAALWESVLAEVRKRPNVSVLSQAEIQSVLTLERQQQLMGCTNDTCAAEFGYALGVDQMLLGSVSKLGASWLMHISLVDVKKVATAAQADRRLKDKSIDDLLDVIPQMVDELFGGPAPTTVPAAAVQAPEPPAGKKTVSGAREEPFDFGGPRPKLTVYTDGAGHYIAVNVGESDGPVFAGNGKALWAQRIIGYGADGQGSFGYTFWEPRGGSRRGSFNGKSGKYVLWCGEQSVAFTPAPKAEANKVLKGAKLYKQRWRRSANTLARDDAGNYYYVDEKRDSDETEDLRIFFGKKGSMRELDVNDTLLDNQGMLVVTPGGRLRVDPHQKIAEWLTSSGTIKLTYIPIGPQEGKLIYGQLGVYKGETFGSACDPQF